MRKPLYAFAIAAVAGLTSLAASAGAAPAVGALTIGGTTPGVDGDGLVHKVHGWHCGPKNGRYAGRRQVHRHLEACGEGDHDFGMSYRYRDSYLYDYSYSPRVRPYNRYRRPLAGRDLYPYLRLKYGRGGWGRGDDD